MSPDNYGFCPHCGANLPADATFCPECGTQIGDAPSENNAGAFGQIYTNEPPSPHATMSGSFMFAFIMIVVYAALSIIGGIMLIVAIDPFTNMMDEVCMQQFGKTFQQYLVDNGLNVTIAELKDAMFLSGVIGVVSGLFAAAAAVLCKMRRKHMIAVVLIIIGSCVNFVTGLSAIVDVVIGLIMAYLVFKAKAYFVD